MAGIQFIDTRPTVESHHGHFLITLDSGGDETKVLLTRHALLGLIVNANRERDIVAEQEMGFHPSEFTLKQRRQTGLREKR